MANTPGEIDIAAEIVARALDSVLAAQRRSDKKAAPDDAWRQHVRKMCADGGAPGAHRFLKGEEPRTATLAQAPFAEAAPGADPRRKASAEAEKWKEKWFADDPAKLHESPCSLAVFRRRSLGKGARPKFKSRTRQQWRELCRALSKAAATGTDNRTVMQLAALSDEGLLEVNALPEMPFKWSTMSSLGRFKSSLV